MVVIVAPASIFSVAAATAATLTSFSEVAMGRRHGRGGKDAGPDSNADFERTLAAAEQDAALDSATGPQSSAAITKCACGSGEFVLEAYLHVIDGRARPDPIEVESLTCPKCGREYEGIVGEGGRILRGDFLGFVEQDEED